MFAPSFLEVSARVERLDRFILQGTIFLGPFRSEYEAARASMILAESVNKQFGTQAPKMFLSFGIQGIKVRKGIERPSNTYGATIERIDEAARSLPFQVMLEVVSSYHAMKDRNPGDFTVIR